MAVKSEGQLGMDETVVDDAKLEASLEKRHKQQASYQAVKANYAAAVAASKLELDRALPELGTYRVGRFRIERKMVEGGHREFDVQPSARISIQTDGD